MLPQAWSIYPLPSIRPGRGRPPEERGKGSRAPRNHRSYPYWTTPCPVGGRYRAIGLLADERTRVVTCGWLVTPQVVVSAGHCVLPKRPSEGNSGFWFANLNDNDEWAWTRVQAGATLAGFGQRRDYRYDLCALRLEHPLEGGTLRPARRREQPERVEICGCPHWEAGGRGANGGYRLWRSQSLDCRWTSQGGWAATNLAEGCSGGPWLAEVDGEMAAVGLTSRGSTGFLLSPPFTESLGALLSWAGAASLKLL